MNLPNICLYEKNVEDKFALLVQWLFVGEYIRILHHKIGIRLYYLNN
jgi:hypothetical protein